MSEVKTPWKPYMGDVPMHLDYHLDLTQQHDLGQAEVDCRLGHNHVPD